MKHNVILSEAVTMSQPKHLLPTNSRLLVDLA